MFKLRFFSGMPSQKRALLAADSFAPIPLFPEVQEHLANLENPRVGEWSPPTTRQGVLWAVVGSIRGLILRTALWKAISAFCILTGVMLIGRILNPEEQLASAILFATLFLLSKLIDATIEKFDMQRRAQMNRAIQAYLMRIVNRKLWDLDPVAALEFTKGELKTLVSSDVEAVEDFISAAVSQWLPALIMFIILGPALIWLTGWHGVVALVSAVCVMPVAIFGARSMEHFQLKAQKEQDELTTAIGEWVRNIRLVRFLNWQGYFTTLFNRIMRRFTVQFAGRHVVACCVYGISGAWWMVPIIAMLLYSEISGSSVTIVELFSSVWILDQLMVYLSHIQHSLSMYGAAAASAERLRKLMMARSLESQMNPAEVPSPSGAPRRVHMENVSLAIDGAHILGPLTVTFDLDARTAIVGPVGSGKSILLELMLGERLPTAGTIVVEFEGGVQRPLWERGVYEKLRDQVGYAPQQPFLSNSLLRNNIDLSTNADDELVRSAARRAQLDSDIRTFRNGLMEEVGETGINLSGGQKQRVSLARALISGRRTLFLDDPLSAVDRSTERLLMDEIVAASVGLVLVSHRLDELQRCDRVLVLDGGRIVEDGKPAALAADRNSRFAQFLRAVEEHG